MQKNWILVIFLFSFFQILNAQFVPSPEERAVQVSATTQISPPQIQLSWKPDFGATEYVIYRKSISATSWGNPIATLSGSATNYTDNNVQVGVGYEYALFKEDFDPVIENVCVPVGTPLNFTINDSNGIGLCCSFGFGFYEIENCNNTIALGDDFGFSETKIFTACNDGSGCSDITITIKPSMFENSTSWTLTNNQTGATIASSGPPGSFIKPRPEYGFIYAGIELPAVEDRGRILLVVEDDLTPVLNNEIADFKLDFIKDGWKVSQIEVDRNDAVTSVRAAIQNVYNQNLDLNAVLLLGHVPIAFSGSIYPDTHTNNEGAYPADVYYGEMDGNWTDNTVNTTAPFLPIYHNVPGDGKFDQDAPPSGVVELQVGRVDFFDMPSFSQSEIQLIQQYIYKNHDFKTRQFNPTRRAIIDDNIGQTIAAPAATGYRNFATMFGHENVFQGDYFSSMSNQSYLWSFGLGSGNVNEAAGVGNISDFANADLKNVFTLLFGSQFGNWAFADVLLRAPLGQGQTLAVGYAGAPPWVLHHMSMGYHIGYSLQQTQNNPNDLYLPAGPAIVSTALLGDPTLRMHYVAPPTNLNASNNSNSVSLNWSAPSNESVIGYYIYRASSEDGDFQRITPNAISNTSFTDQNPLTGNNVYQVKTLKLENSGSGSYYNLSLGAMVSTQFSGGGGDTTPPTASLSTASGNVTAPFTVNVLFSENVQGLSLSDFNISNGNASNLSGSSANYSLTISPISVGQVSIVLPAQRVVDLAGNPNVSASNTLLVNYSTGGGGGCNNPVNLALNKVSTQHSTQFGADASRANDGNTNGNFWAGNSVSITNWAQQTWWEVDLGSVAQINEIKIYNRTDCCASVLSNFYVFVSENPFNSTNLNSTLNQNGVSNFLETGIAGSPTTVPVNTSGRYVRVQLSGQGFLALAEVEVIGCVNGGGGTDQTINFPPIPNKTIASPDFPIFASASSGLPVGFSILSGPATISGNTISLTGNPGTVIVQASQSGNAQFNAAPTVTQSFEVTDDGSGGCDSPTNLALNKPATQHSTQFGAEAARAVDGNTDGNFWFANSTSLTNWAANTWWEVDLQQVADIENIQIWNRSDCCGSVFNNYYVFVSDTPFASSNLNTTISQQGVSNFLQNTVAGFPTTVPINRTGRYVRIQLSGTGFLPIAEVAVNGCFSINTNGPSTLIISPNEYLIFDAQASDRAVAMDWITNTEYKNDFFIIEKSENGVDFEQLMEVESKGSSYAPVHYNNKDTNPFLGKNYYRLIQVLEDGTEIFSAIHEVDFQINLNELVIYPNPAKDLVFINLKEMEGQAVTLQIFDSKGELKIHREWAALENPNQKFDISNFNNGLFLIAVKVKGKRLMTRKFVVAKD